MTPTTIVASTVNAISKVLETDVYALLHLLLEREGLVSDRQYRLPSHRPTDDLLGVISHSWSATLEYHGETHLVSLDIGRVFNRVWNEALLPKLSSFGLHSALLSWMSCFLLRVNNILSQTISENQDIPQGPTLSLILFGLSMNDLPTSTPNVFHRFSDDATFYCSLSSYQVLVKPLPTWIMIALIHH